jgi:hypothetical protein
MPGRRAGFTWDYESWVQIFAGETRSAASLVDDVDALAEVTYTPLYPAYGALVLAACRLRDELTRPVERGTNTGGNAGATRSAETREAEPSREGRDAHEEAFFQSPRARPRLIGATSNLRADVRLLPGPSSVRAVLAF